VKKYYPNITIDTVNIIYDSWRVYDFSPYDAVFHVAGIAHADVGNADEKTKRKYYSVNTDLAIETVERSKEAVVGQFMFISSMIVYGGITSYGRKKLINERMIPCPANFCEDNRWQADKRGRKLGSGVFNITVFRLPMVYGRDSKSNYPVLGRLAKCFPVFPDVNNEQSMLHIDNLCEFLSLLVLS